MARAPGKKLDRIRTGALILMELEPVYGATVLVLAERVQLLAIEAKCLACVWTNRRARK